jgi:dihydrofolate synthase/folylpolyglutamate synthase
VNFQEAESYLLSLGNEVETMKLGLDNIRKLLAALGNPETNYLKVQVAGTNGKGSVCAFLDSICLHAGIKTGVFTSPHLMSITERVRIDGADISEEEFGRIASVVRETSEGLVADGELETVPTYFEQVTAIALVAFREAKVELTILETGLGGRYDATTAANAEIAAITRIDLDHQEYLGETIAEIAAEKAAILRADSVVCIGNQGEIPETILIAKCASVGVKPFTLKSSVFDFYDNAAHFYFPEFGFTGGEVFLSIAGKHQVENAALAILIAKQSAIPLAISDENIFEGLENAKHPGRLEWIECDDVRILLDGAHNPSGAEALADYIQELESNVVLVYGSMRDKDAEQILTMVVPLVSDVILTEPANSRSFAATSIAALPMFAHLKEKVFVIPHVADAIDSSMQIAKTYTSRKPAFVLVTGSLYLVGEVRRILTGAGK